MGSDLGRGWSSVRDKLGQHHMIHLFRNHDLKKTIYQLIIFTFILLGFNIYFFFALLQNLLKFLSDRILVSNQFAKQKGYLR